MAGPNSSSVLDLFRLDGRTALVTGGGQGIGRAFCIALAQAGAGVAVVDMNIDAAQAVAKEVRNTGAPSMAIEANVTDPDGVDAAVKRVVDNWGGLTIAVNNAGISQWIDAESSSLEEWRSVLSVNLDGVFVCCKAEARVMLQAGYGKISAMIR